MSTENFKIELIVNENHKECTAEVKPIVHNKKSRKHKTKITLSKEECEETIITWRLLKFIQAIEIYDGIEFFPISAKDRLTNEITAEKIVKFLNSNFLFDFDYLPKENDEIRMEIDYVIENINGKYRRPYINGFVSFIYNGKIWIINNGFDHLHNDYEEFKEGIVKYIV